MRAKPKLDLGLSAYDELFMDANERAVQKLPRIYDIPIDLIDDFPDHPFKVKQDEDMDLLTASMQASFLLCPDTISYLPSSLGRIVTGVINPCSFILAVSKSISSSCLTLKG